MTKFSWEPLDRGSLLLRITDGDRETTWKVRKNTTTEKLQEVFTEMLFELGSDASKVWDYPPMVESVRTVDAEELAELRGTPGQATTEEASKAALAAKAASVSAAGGNFWRNFKDTDDRVYEIGHGGDE